MSVEEVKENVENVEQQKAANGATEKNGESKSKYTPSIPHPDTSSMSANLTKWLSVLIEEDETLELEKEEDWTQLWPELQGEVTLSVPFEGNKITKADWKCLMKNCPKCIALSIIECGLEEIEIPDEEFPEIQVIDISNNKLKSIDFVKKCQGLCSLVCANNEVKPEDMKVLAEVKGFQLLEMGAIKDEEEVRKKMFEMIPNLMGCNGFDKDGVEMADEEGSSSDDEFGEAFGDLNGESDDDFSDDGEEGEFSEEEEGEEEEGDDDGADEEPAAKKAKTDDAAE